MNWLGRLSIVQKFLLIGLIGILAVALPTYRALTSAIATYEVAATEAEGVPPLELILHAQFQMMKARGASLMVEHDASHASDLSAATKEADEALSALSAMIDAREDFAPAKAPLAALKSSWSSAKQVSGDAGLEGYNAALVDANTVLDLLRDLSGYTYSPYVDAYHLHLATMVEAPRFAEATMLMASAGVEVLEARAHSEGLASSAEGEVDDAVAVAAAEEAREAAARVAEEVGALRIHGREEVTAFDAYLRNLQKAMAADASLDAKIKPFIAKSKSEFDALKQYSEGVATGSATEEQSAYFARVAGFAFEVHEFSDQLLEVLQGQSQKNADQQKSTMLWLAVQLAVLILLAGIVLLSVGQSVIGSVREAEKAAGRIAKLQLDQPIRATTGDELGRLMRALSQMQDDLRARIERDQAIAAENARIRSALDTASGGMMIADTEGKIIYVNKAIEKTLRESEREIAEVIKGFSADNVVGSSFDAFHQQPNKQRDLLKNLKGTHFSRIKLANHAFEVFANPVFSAQGERLGTAVEWLDRTAESEFRHGLRNVVQRAAAGLLNARVEVKVDEPRFIELAEIVNNLIGTTANSIAEVEKVMGALADGNLSLRSKAVLAGKFGELNDNANKTADALAQVIGEIQAVIDQINAASREIADGNNDLSLRTEQAAANIEETAAALHEVNSMVSSSADNAREAKVLASRAADTAAEGGRVVQEVVDTMQAIRESSKKMSDIISVIDGIAFQTNILALNAAVEAARAGEQGRGFAVVASEVRALAQRSADAAKEIAGLIRDSETRVESGAELVHRAGTRMDEIVTSAKQVADIVADISSAAVEQAKGIGEVNAAVEQMDQATQANAALVEEMAASAQSLALEAKRLDQVASRFVLDGKADAPIANFSDMIKSHQAWKVRLRDVLDGRSTEKLDAAVVKKDNACAMGQWIYGPGAQLANMREYAELKEHHAKFHRCAGTILELNAGGQHDKAEQMLERDFRGLSERCIDAIKTLSDQVR